VPDPTQNTRPQLLVAPVEGVGAQRAFHQVESWLKRIYERLDEIETRLAALEDE